MKIKKTDGDDSNDDNDDVDNDDAGNDDAGNDDADNDPAAADDHVYVDGDYHRDGDHDCHVAVHKDNQNNDDGETKKKKTLKHEGTETQA